MSTIKGRIHSVETFGALDGPGVRYLLFLQGCPLQCLYCHNPDSWDPKDGQVRTVEEVFADIQRYRSFLSGGVTLSGGEPLMQPEFCEALFTLCREHGIHTALDTAGSLPLSVCKEAVDLADLILLDLKAMDPNDCKRLTGRDNHNAISLLDYREASNMPVWVRHVLVPGITLKEEKLREMANFLKGYTCVQRVELLPFHKMGEYKWEQLGRPYTLTDTPQPTREEGARAKAIFRVAELPIPS